MKDNQIVLTTCESGDWQILQYGNYQANGHSLTAFDWIELLKHLGYDVEKIELTDEEMERLC